MAKQRSEKSRYPSRYSPNGWVSSYQYVTELVCEKKAQQDGGELPIKFWDLKEWRSFYRYQITLASSLIRQYGEDSVIAALRDSRSYKTYSLRSSFLKSIIEEYKSQKDSEPLDKKERTSYDFESKENFTSNNNKRSIISELEDLEND